MFYYLSFLSTGHDKKIVYSTNVLAGQATIDEIYVIHNYISNYLGAKNRPDPSKVFLINIWRQDPLCLSSILSKSEQQWAINESIDGLKNAYFLSQISHP